ncbi:MAG TPA: fatty acyl-AMP ligase [Kofleriaceae bacterium]|nr:fatty acyl-AMP ligase [Kofleriaceae bacterium]
MSLDLQNAPSIPALLRQHAADLADHEAVTLVRDAGPTTLSYALLDRASRAVAAWLQARFSPGERVLLLYPVGLDFVPAFLGCLYAGMIAVPAPMPGGHLQQRRRVDAIAHDAGIAAVFTDSANLADVSDWLTAHGRAALPGIATDVDALGDPDAWQMPAIDRRTVMLLQYTSGSTGDPKGVMVGHGNLLHNAGAFTRGLGLGPNTRFGGWIPMYHDMGLLAQLMPGLLLGSSVTLMTPQTFIMRPHLWLRMIDRHDLQFSAAPNFAYELCQRRITDAQIGELDLSRWTHAANGSEPVQSSTLLGFARRFAAAGFRAEALAPCYGMAEATVYISGRAGRPPCLRTLDAERLARDRFVLADGKAATRPIVGCGTAADYDVRIVDPATGHSLRAGEIGEIWLRGPSVAHGYWHRPDATAATFQAITDDGQGGYLRTGDLGTVVDGEIYITGRHKEMLIVHGRNLYPQDIEHEVRLQHPELATRLGAVFSVAPPDEEEAVVVTHELAGKHPEERMRELAFAIKSTVSREFGVRVAGVVLLRPGAVERTTSGKIRRAAMRERFLANELDALHESLEPALHALRPPRAAGAAAS